MSTVGDRQILNAARACVLAAGVHETTFNDIARRAGVSRMTLYRRYSDVGSLISELLGREFARILREHTQVPPGAAPDPRPARQRLVETVVACVEAFQEDPLMTQVLDAEPEILTPYLFNKFGSTQQIAIDLLAHRLNAGHQDGSIRRGSVAVQAHAIVLTVQSFIVSASASGPVPRDRLRSELVLILDGYLRPTCGDEDTPASAGSTGGW
ncbi:TetR/AcrR family transcriptional regulator [Actinospica sp. MGRD01-02]|uniref:TetR/AcrR family transcriptional regulator n=1 Tax=Actinospica acidithermotolerans TaxID=2828514 RepID=A0A941IIR2_9ACTN|nr:TetR/AcrR family transcriptional regulator [Actinospica acidithermotolerans]MBR7828614.1 TetR/AcrR family transcriptional regulator [Actinospica acidithermotolerans]